MPIDLTNCDLEPIHIPGQIQAHGALLAIDPAALRVLQASDNTARFLEVPAAELLDRPLSALLEPADLAALQVALADDRLEDSSLHIFSGRVCGRGPFHVVGHLHEGLLVLELEPVHAAPSEAADFYGLLKHSVLRFQRALGLTELSQVVTDEVRKIAGYDRVLVYRFDGDWSGHVIAESRAPGKGLESFLDLHFPASDIPARARALFLKNAVRMLPDARYRQSPLVPGLNPRTGRPLDLTFSFLRGASQMYTEYLTNLGVQASLTMSITRGDRLWGMIACHHLQPRQVPYGVRAACELIARVVSLQIAEQQAQDEAAYEKRIIEVHERLFRTLALRDDLARALLDGEPNVRALVDCGGVAVISQGQVHTLGQTPGPDALRALAEWVRKHQPTEIFSTDALASLYPPGAAIQDTSAGVLAVRLSPAPGDCVLWLRPEQQRTVSWAGDPNKPVEVGPTGDRLTPRKSFALWQETVRGRSAPWVELEVDAVRKLRTMLAEVVHRRGEELTLINLELERSNSELDAFAYVASHDLKEPLRGIYHFSNFVLQDSEGKLDEDNKKKMETIVRLTKRMQALIESLLHYSRMGRNALTMEAVDLGAAVRETMEVLEPRLVNAGVTLSVPRPLPVVRADRVGLQEILVNLLSNAIKYNDKPDKQVEVGCLTEGEPGFPGRVKGRGRAFYVRDNGIGIADSYREEVFRIFKRLHPQTEFGGGTGAGLTIVRKVVERHGGQVWCESEPGVGTTFFFTLGAA